MATVRCCVVLVGEPSPDSTSITWVPVAEVEEVDTTEVRSKMPRPVPVSSDEASVAVVPLGSAAKRSGCRATD